MQVLTQMVPQSSSGKKLPIADCQLTIEKRGHDNVACGRL
jgi:hypothetical protein